MEFMIKGTCPYCNGEGTTSKYEEVTITTGINGRHLKKPQIYRDFVDYPCEMCKGTKIYEGWFEIGSLDQLVNLLKETDRGW